MDRQATEAVELPRADVCVVGAGLAGVCAALAAARCGARTVLVNDRPVLGGNSSSELRIPPGGAGYYNPWATETGIIHELIMEDRAHNHEPVQYGHANAIWDLVLYDACRRQANLSVHLNTNITTVSMAERRIEAVSGPQARSGLTLTIPARIFLDCTGDGAVGAAAGVPCRVGAEARSEYGETLAPEHPDDFVMGSSLIFRARDTGREVPFVPPPWAVRYDFPDGIPYRSTAYFAGGYWWIEIGWPLDTLHDDERIRDQLLAHVLGVWDHIKNRGRERAAARTWALDWVGFVPARRESRRFVGAYVLTQQDLQSATPFLDAIAYGGWSIDDHTRGGITALDQRPSFDAVAPEDYFVTPYPVPLRSLFSHEVDNLLFAGRMLSASRIAFSSLRVQQTLAVIGQAAGTAAAWCARRDCLPRDIADPTPIQQRLIRDGCWVPGVRGQDLARTGAATASSVAPIEVLPGEGGHALATDPAVLVPVSAGKLQRALLYLDNLGEAGMVRLTVHPAQHIWDLRALQAEPVAAAEAQAPPGNGWLCFELATDLPTDSLVWLRATGPPHVRWRWGANSPIGVVAAYRHPSGTVWFGPGSWSRWVTLAVRLEPPSRPYTAAQALRGVPRPCDYVNAWVSDPAQPLPQWLEVSFSAPVTFDTISLVFDTGLHRINYVTPGLFRAPECVRDYTVAARVHGQWRELVRVTDNYQRLREHRVEPIAATTVRLIVTATNGDPSARVYGLRLYRDGQEGGDWGG